MRGLGHPLLDAVGDTVHQRDQLARALAGLLRANGEEDYDGSEAMWHAAEEAASLVPLAVLDRANAGPEDGGPYFVIHFRDNVGSPPMRERGLPVIAEHDGPRIYTEPFVGAGARAAAFRTYDDRKQGWSEVWLAIPVRGPR